MRATCAVRARTRNAPGRTRIKAIVAAALLALLSAGMTAPMLAQEAPGVETRAPAATPSREELGRLFDAVAETTAREFWDKERLQAVDWPARAAAVRDGVVGAANLEDAVRRINGLLSELKTSHTVLLTPDDVDYYVLLDVFTRNEPNAHAGRRGKREGLAALRGRYGVRYAGVGIFTARIDGHDFVDGIIEGSPADQAGIKIGDEIAAVDGEPFHPIRSFRGKLGERASVAVRRSRDGPVENLGVEVVRIAPLQAFSEATRASARVIERAGKRIGYVHVWASVGDGSAEALTGALARLGVARGVARLPDEETENGRSGESGQPATTKAIDALIIDMRGRIGGTGSTAGRYLDILDPRGPRVRWRNARSDRPWTSLRGRTAVLIDRHTRSTGELFVHAYKRERQGPLIGTRTAAAVSGATAFAMPGGNLLYLAVSGLELDGEIVEGAGVAPDIEVPQVLPYSRGADPVIDAAVDVLVARTAAKGGNSKPDGNSTSQ